MEDKQVKDTIAYLSNLVFKTKSRLNKLEDVSVDKENEVINSLVATKLACEFDLPEKGTAQNDFRLEKAGMFEYILNDVNETGAFIDISKIMEMSEELYLERARIAEGNGISIASLQGMIGNDSVSLDPSIKEVFEAVLK